MSVSFVSTCLVRQNSTAVQVAVDNGRPFHSNTSPKGASEQAFGPANTRSKTSPQKPRRAWIAFWSNTRKRIQTLRKKGLRGLSPQSQNFRSCLFGKRQPTAGEREVRQTRRNRSGNQPQERRTSHLPCAAGLGDCSNPTNGETAVATRILFRWPSGRNGSDACAARSPRVGANSRAKVFTSRIAATAGCGHIRQAVPSQIA